MRFWWTLPYLPWFSLAPRPPRASPDEAVSWGKIRRDAKPVKLCAEATLVLPLLVGETFAKHFEPKESAAKAAKTE